MLHEFTIINDLSLGSSDRVSIFGKTGAGKTFFSKNWLLPHYTRYIFWDIKKENNDINHDIIITTSKELKKNISSYNKILYQPSDLRDEDFNDICEIIFNSGDITLYVDEASFISNPNKLIYWHRVLLTQGRSRNIGVINVSLRPRDIHNTLISESEHLFIFSLNLETDVSKLRFQIGDAANEIISLQEHYFIYYNVRMNKSFLFKPVMLLDINEPETLHKLELYKPSLEEYLKLTS